MRSVVSIHVVATAVAVLCTLISSTTGLTILHNSEGRQPKVSNHVDEVPKTVAGVVRRLAQQVGNLASADKTDVFPSHDQVVLASEVPGAVVHTSVRQSLLRLNKVLQASSKSVSDWVAADDMRRAQSHKAAAARYQKKSQEASQARHALETFVNASLLRQEPFSKKLAKLEKMQQDLEADINQRQQELDKRKAAKLQSMKKSQKSKEASSQKSSSDILKRNVSLQVDQKLGPPRVKAVASTPKVSPPKASSDLLKRNVSLQVDQKLGPPRKKVVVAAPKQVKAVASAPPKQVKPQKSLPAKVKTVISAPKQVKPQKSLPAKVKAAASAPKKVKAVKPQTSQPIKATPKRSVAPVVSHKAAVKKQKLAAAVPQKVPQQAAEVKKPKAVARKAQRIQHTKAAQQKKAPGKVQKLKHRVAELKHQISSARQLSANVSRQLSEHSRHPVSGLTSVSKALQQQSNTLDTSFSSMAREYIDQPNPTGPFKRRVRPTLPPATIEYRKLVTPVHVTRNLFAYLSGKGP